ncbi:MAG: hypothetical protein V4489_05720 [Chlamydiota bacterium]
MIYKKGSETNISPKEYYSKDLKSKMHVSIPNNTSDILDSTSEDSDGWQQGFQLLS